jgi:hypothetical protein
MAADGTAAALEQIESLRFSHEVRLLGEIRRRFGAIPLMDFDASERMLDPENGICWEMRSGSPKTCCPMSTPSTAPA